MALKIIDRNSKHPNIFSFDDQTDHFEVSLALSDIINQYKTSANIWVISGTHGNSDGTVTSDNRESIFKREDLLPSFRSQFQN